MDVTNSITTFNIHHGIGEALVHGLKASFLTLSDYDHLCQCETIEDIKMNLQETDYNMYIADEPSPILPSTLHNKALKKLVDDFTFIRAHSCYPLSQFLDFISYEYMIDNVMLLLKGTSSDTSVDVSELLAQCHPLGMFKESTMRSIVAFENTPQGYTDLYHVVLIDTPVGKYFAEYFKIQSQNKGGAEMKYILDDTSLAVLESSIMNLYLEDFYEFCMNLNDGTSTIMHELLSERADQVSLNITINSFDTKLSDPSNREKRKALYPSFGLLYPHGIDLLNKCDDMDSLTSMMNNIPFYNDLWTRVIGNSESLDDIFYSRNVRLMENAFEGQMHFAVFYGFVKLKEQEIRNLVWISECIIQNQKEYIEKYIPIFNKLAPWRSEHPVF